MRRPPPFRDWPLAWKTTTLVALGSILPMLVLVLVGLGPDLAQVREARVAALEARAEAVAGQLDMLHVGYEEAAERLARFPEVAQSCAAPSAARDALGPALDARLAERARALNVAGVALVDASGAVVDASTPALRGVHVGAAPELRRALAGRAGVADTFAVVPALGPSPMLAYFAPVGPGDRPAGAVVLWAPAERFWRVLRASAGRAGPASYAVLFDRHGTRIGHGADESLLFHPAAPLAPGALAGFVTTRRFGDRTAALGRPVPFASLDRLRGGGVARHLSPANHQWNLAVGRPVAVDGWTLVYLAPEAALRARLATVAWTAASEGLVGALLALGAAVLVSAWIARPVRALAAAAEAVARGDFGVRVGGLAGDELGQLGASFHAMADSLRDHEAELEERSRELAAARDAALAAVRLKSEFLATMSHEIRTPLNGVLGMMELLRGTPLDAEQRPYVETARYSGEALLAIVNDILDFSKIEAGRMDLEALAFDPRSLVDDVAGTFAARAARAGLSLATDVDPAVPARVCGDPTRLRQVLNNLLGNALKFTHAGGVTVAVGRAEDPGGAVALRFEVRDTGIGIEAGAVAHLFQAFTQADNSTTRRYGGTGLGLAISRRLVGLLGGEIGVETAPDEGSTFWFTARFLPVAGTLRPAPRDLAPPRASGRPSYGPRGASLRAPATAADGDAGRRVLVVEDNPVNRRVITRLLEQRGYRVDAAADGVEAVEAAARRRYALVFMDCQMPRMDGYEATRALRRAERPGGHRTPIVAMTANALAGDRERCLAAGMDDYLSKPIAVPLLEAALARWAPEGRGTSQEAEARPARESSRRAPPRASAPPAG